MRVVLSGGWRAVGLVVTMGASAVSGFSGCAKRPSPSGEAERPPGFYLADADALESAESIKFLVELVGGASEKVRVQLSVTGWPGNGEECQKIADVAPNGSGLPKDGFLKSKEGIDCAIFQGDIPAHPYAGNIKGIYNKDTTKVPVSSDVFRESIEFAPGDTSHIVEIPLVHIDNGINGGKTNGYYERDKIFNVTLTGGRDGPTIHRASATGLIKNVDPAPTVSLRWSNLGMVCASSSSCEVSEQTQPTKALSVIVNGKSDLPIKVPLTLAGSAIPWSDYIIFNGGAGGEGLSGKNIPLASKLIQYELIVPSFGETTSAVIEVIDDAEEETDETIVVSVPRQSLVERNTQIITKNKKSYPIQDISVVDQSEAVPVTIKVSANDAHTYTRRAVSPMYTRSCMQVKTQGNTKLLDLGTSATCPSPDVSSTDPGGDIFYSAADFPGQDAVKAEGMPEYTLYAANGEELWKSGQTGNSTIIFESSTNSQVVGVKRGDGTDADVACIKDNRSGLLWEAKNYHTGASYKDPAKDVYSLHAQDMEFTTISRINKQSPIACMEYGAPGVAGKFTQCSVDYFVAEVNHERLCGKTGWRLPTVEELRGLVRYDTVPRWKNPLASTLVADSGIVFFHDANFFWWLSDSSGISATAFSGAYLSGDTTHNHSDSSMGDVGLGLIFKNEVTSPVPNVIEMYSGQVVLVHD